ncbi:8443_t:CDS:10 [Ambispora gerdemannii]|uniref:8443_t:CDS:1 n=1 Tax=Ambispora gerdemannii TaxID=144530 RepID=A0A9N8WSD8_9GLOM|nr:8443_t:CDS:10 [Ambispora gerdemannii]
MEEIKESSGALRRPRENESDKESQSTYPKKSINDKLTLMTQHASNRAKKSELKIHINELEKLVHWHGLEEEQLSDLLDLVFSAKLDAVDTKRIIKLLIPRRKISENLVIKILGKLGYGLVTHPIQVKRRKVDEIIIPRAQTSNVTEKSVTIDDVINFKQLASKIDKLELPNQLASALDNRMLQHILICNPERITLTRITNWLSQCLMELTYWSDQDIETKNRLTSLLEKLIVMTEFIKELLPIFEDFLKKFIITWNGEQNQELIFKLLTYIKPQAFNDLYQDFLFPLHRLFYVSSAEWKAKLILCYVTLLRYWASLIAIKSDSQESLDQTNDSAKHFIFGQMDPSLDYMESIQKFILYCDDISITSLEAENDDIVIQHAVLSFYESVVSLQLENSWDKIVMPSSSIVYRCFFSSSGMALSRICAIVLHYKEAFDKREKRAIQLGIFRHNRSYVNHFNSFVMDICNCLWRNRPFSKTDKNSKGFQLDNEVIENIKEICGGNSWVSHFSLTHLLSLSSYSKNCITEIENSTPNLIKEQISPITLQSLKESAKLGGIKLTFSEYRVIFLNYLLDQGFFGLHAFLYNSLTSLSKMKPQS